MRSGEELLAVSGYSRRADEFDRLIQLLDHELRLITPTESGEPRAEGGEPDSGRDASGSPPSALSSPLFYQLTHDYLVPSLRDWLTRKQKETRRGRAELRLAERAAAWNVKPESRHLPALWEYVNIRCFAHKKHWTPPQRQMMRRAFRYHALCAAIVAALLLVLGLAGRESYGHVVARGLVEKLLAAQIQQVPGIVTQLEGYRKWADPRLEAALAEAAEGSSEKLHASLGLLPVDASQTKYLYARVLKAQPAEVPVLRDMLLGPKDRLVERLWSVMATPESHPGPERLRAAALLAVFDPDQQRWKHSRVDVDVASQLLLVDASLLAQWMETLRPVSQFLVAPLSDIVRDPAQPAVERSLAAYVLASYAAEEPDELARLVAAAGEVGQFGTLFSALQSHGQRGLDALAPLVREREPPAEPGRATSKTMSEPEKDADAKRRATRGGWITPLGGQ